jgi:hypothetical protein
MGSIPFEIKENVLKSFQDFLVSIPFEIKENVLKSFQDFFNNTINWIELELVDESVHLVTSKTIESNEKLQQFVCPDNARFILTKLTKINGEKNSFFIFSCPENTKPRIKMTMSTAKVIFNYKNNLLLIIINQIIYILY